MGLGFLLLVVLLRAPLAAAAAVALNLLATAAAFGVARLVFQDGALERLLGFESQGFVDAWAPIFFFALVFALAMDYTVFLLATIKEAHERTGDAREAVVEGLAGTGRVINAAAAVMVVVFMTFALAGPIPPKEMGFILAVAVLLDATLVRLLLQPVVLRLLGPRAWWMPAWLDRLAAGGRAVSRHAGSSASARRPARRPRRARRRAGVLIPGYSAAMPQENVDLTRRAFQAFDDRDLDALLAMMDEAVEAFPVLAGMEGGYLGHEGIRRWWATLYDTFPDFRAEVLEVRDDGDLTIATLRIRGRGAGSDTPVDATVWQLTEFRSGRCVGWRAYPSKHDALEAAGLSE